jgi:hypothetical protein
MTTNATMTTHAKRILVVEDEGIIAMELAHHLREFGYEVVGAAADVAEALALAERERPDLVMMDIVLRSPVDGIETARRLRATRDLPVVFLTAYSDATTLERAKQAAPYGYLLKPYRPEELRAAVATALNKHEMQRLALETARKEIDQVSYSLSHNLRTPLRAINSFAQLLASEQAAQLDGEARRLLERVTHGALQMGELVDGLIGFMALSRRALQLVALEPAALVQGVLQERGAEIAARAIEVEVGHLPACRADALLLRGVFEHLIGNALKFTAGTARPRIEIGARADRGRTVYSVADNGAGFDMRHYGKLFGLYESLHSPGEFEGAGVGLALTRRIVERHGGRIWAESRPGDGATFFFTLGTGEPPR